jgi:hypothetical protein
MVQTIKLPLGTMNTLLLACLSIVCLARLDQRGLVAEAFVVPAATRTAGVSTRPLVVGTTFTRHTPRLFETSPEKPPEKPDKADGPLDFIFNPYESKIPKEIEKEIYEAEGNTPAAKERTQRVITYAAVAFVGVLFAFFNAFMTELRNGPTPDGNPVDLVATGFGWVMSNPVTSFLFLNKIGGGICLLGGAGSGLLAEAEFDSRRLNAEKIYGELVKRREGKEKRKSSSDTKKKGKKRRPGKEVKRMEALSEVVRPGQEETKAEPKGTLAEEIQAEKPDAKVEKKDDDGLLGKIKGFYEKADNMAASQALLLNKELEERGVVEKITDESGLKVIGKDAASKLKEEKSESNDETKQ